MGGVEGERLLRLVGCDAVLLGDPGAVPAPLGGGDGEGAQADRRAAQHRLRGAGGAAAQRSASRLSWAGSFSG